MSAQLNRVDPSVVFVDTLQDEVALGNLGRGADERRCEIFDSYVAGRDQVSSRIIRSVNGAQASFEHLHGEPFCSAGVPAIIKASSR